jgi:hypothetical protein
MYRGEETEETCEKWKMVDFAQETCSAQSIVTYLTAHL